jgi:hypothetical protein
MKTYHNPRMEAVIDNWPYGRDRTTATFKVERHATRGERGTRFTVDPKTGRPGATKTLTYSALVRIVDGDDGRTYIAEWSGNYGFVTIMRSDMKLQEETIWPKDDRFEAVRALFG